MRLLDALEQILFRLEKQKERARRACALIVERGYHRGRDLSSLLTVFLAAE